MSSVESILIEAVKNEDIEFLTKCFNYGLDSNILIKDTPLFHYVNSIEMINLFLNHGCNINITNKEHESLLFKTEDTTLLHHLISKGMDVNMVNIYGSNRLHYHVHNNEVIKLLIQNGIDINAKNAYGATPLHLINNTGAIRLLLLSGADVNARDKTDHTPLHNVLDVECAKLLVLAGGDLNAKDNEDRTPYEIAIALCRDKVADYLFKISNC